jgi:hypothetical protein
MSVSYYTDRKVQGLLTHELVYSTRLLRAGSHRKIKRIIATQAL